jgi:hypothetical protein
MSTPSQEGILVTGSDQKAQKTARICRCLAIFCFLLGLAVSRESDAETIAVPVSLQAQLLAKAVAYDKNFLARAGERAKLLLVVKPGNADSTVAASEMKAALSSMPDIGTLPHDEEILPYVGAQALANACRERKAAVVYLGAGFSAEIPSIRDAFSSIDVLTVGGGADYVPAGIVLGFDLASGKPKILVHMTQGRKQHVDFRAAFLSLVRIYE